MIDESYAERVLNYLRRNSIFIENWVLLILIDMIMVIGGKNLIELFGVLKIANIELLKKEKIQSIQLDVFSLNLYALKIYSGQKYLVAVNSHINQKWGWLDE